MDFALRAFHELYPDKQLNHILTVKYSAKFKDYRANIQLRGNKLTFGLSRKWEHIGDDIKIGLCQELLNRLFKTKKQTINIDMYNSFVKTLHHVVPKTKTDSLLAETFTRVNERFFNGLLEQPNFTWGESIYKLGSYDYHTDTIMISKILTQDPELLEYVLYHEMLHKKLKFSHGSRKCYHSKEFRNLEHKFGDYHALEKRLHSLIHKNRPRRFSLWRQ